MDQKNEKNVGEQRGSKTCKNGSLLNTTIKVVKVLVSYSTFFQVLLEPAISNQSPYKKAKDGSAYASDSSGLSKNLGKSELLKLACLPKRVIGLPIGIIVILL